MRNRDMDLLRSTVLPMALALSLSASMTKGLAQNAGAKPKATSPVWAVADGATGEVLASQKGDLPLKSASTTKVMCALVVLEIAQKEPGVLEEQVTFSKLADDTEGASAGLKAGEKISVHDGLRGMLLPSGNDMANALAEHFNNRLSPPGAETPATVTGEKFATRQNFIAEMNRVAVRLGMEHTKYRLPYNDGGTEGDRTTTAHDLLKLGAAAMKSADFREVVKTRKYTGKVTTREGMAREITWENTNKLLALEGYDGIKTGQTNAAGYCLLATGEKSGCRLYVVVMGAATEAERFADAQALFAWGWDAVRAEK